MTNEYLHILKQAHFNFATLNYIDDENLDDAIQQAVLAALEGKSPSNAANSYCSRERKHKTRERSNMLDANGTIIRTNPRKEKDIDN